VTLPLPVLDADLAGRIRFSRPYIDKRREVLTEYGLLENLPNGVYVSTDEGEQYLDTAELEPDREKQRRYKRRSTVGV